MHEQTGKVRRIIPDQDPRPLVIEFLRTLPTFGGFDFDPEAEPLP